MKLKRYLKYGDNVYFEPVRQHIVYQALTYLKSYNKFYEDMCYWKRYFWLKRNDWKYKWQKWNRVCFSWRSLNISRTASNETALVSDIPNIINDENVIIAPGQGKKTVPFLSDEFCEEPAFLFLLPKGQFCYNAPRDFPISPARYFNQRLLNYN